jgi:hypothetical protein
LGVGPGVGDGVGAGVADGSAIVGCGVTGIVLGAALLPQAPSTIASVAKLAISRRWWFRLERSGVDMASLRVEPGGVRPVRSQRHACVRTTGDAHPPEA